MIEGHGDDLYGKKDIRMNFSSNIYSSPGLKALEKHLQHHLNLIRHYPPPAATELEQLLAEEYGVEEQQVMVTSGATDAIYLIAQTFRDRHTFKVFPPTFSEYEDACRIFGYEESPGGALCWICNPNNPTGGVVNNNFICQLSRQHKWVVVDQSYEDYTLEPMMSGKEAVKLGNVMQIRSLTKKFAIPGLRLGFVIASETVISQLKTQYRPWAVNALAIEAGTWLINNHIHIIPDLENYLRQAQEFCLQLAQIEGINVIPSKTNFMLCTVRPQDASTLKDYLIREHHMLIRDASNFRGLTPHHFRISSQSVQENQALTRAIREFFVVSF